MTGKISPFRTRKQKIMLKRLKMHMKNTNFCAKANMKRDANRVEPARRVLLKAGAVLLAVLVLFCTACGKRGSGDAIQTNLPQSAAPQTSEPVPQQGGSLSRSQSYRIRKRILFFQLIHRPCFTSPHIIQTNTTNKDNHQ